MGLIYQTESWETYYKDARLLWPQHYAEMCQDKARLPFGPDVGWYEGCARANVLQIVTGRDGNGFLAAYQLSIIRPHAHYSGVLCSFEDMYYLDPLYRKGPEGLRLVKESLRFLEARGVQRAYFFSSVVPVGRVKGKPARTSDALFPRLGFKPTHKCWAKDLHGSSSGIEDLAHGHR